MEEKIVIKSKQCNIKKIRRLIWFAGIVIYIVGSLMDISALMRYLSAEYIEWWGISHAITSIIEWFMIPLAIIVFPFIAIGQLFYTAMSKIEMTVTTKRVYGKALFGKRVDLPLDMISAVGTTFLHGIAVTTASGAIKFLMIKNSEEIHTAISKLLMERQDANKKSASTVVKQEIPQSNAEELRRYKELLDLGVITQDEFDAKKKQLLGL